ncbi:hypothetical protein [Halostagnicola bangensis]
MTSLRSPLPPIQPVRDGLTDESLRFAILAGLATIPITLLLSWEVVTDDVAFLGGTISGAPLLLAALVVGYRYSDRETTARRAGVWTGLGASAGTILIYLANTATTMWDASAELAAIAALLTPPTIILGVGLTVLVTTATAMFSGWVGTRLDRNRRVVDSHETVDRTVRNSRWWIPVAAYALAAPITLVGAFALESRSELHGLLAALLTICLAFVSVIAFVSLFIDATAPRAAETDWIPNLWLYVGLPIGGYALVYLVAAVQQVPGPSAPGMFGFLTTLWAATVMYVVARHRHVGTV